MIENEPQPMGLENRENYFDIVYRWWWSDTKTIVKICLDNEWHLNLTNIFWLFDQMIWWFACLNCLRNLPSLTHCLVPYLKRERSMKNRFLSEIWTPNFSLLSSEIIDGSTIQPSEKQVWRLFSTFSRHVTNYLLFIEKIKSFFKRLVKLPTW